MGRKTMGEEFHESKIITQAKSKTKKTKMTISGHNETTALLVYRTDIRIRQAGLEGTQDQTTGFQPEVLRFLEVWEGNNGSQ